MSSNTPVRTLVQFVLIVLICGYYKVCALQSNNTIKSNNTQGVIVYCSSRMIRVNVFRKYYPNVNPQQVSFRDGNGSRCKAEFFNDSVIVLKAALALCGTKHTEQRSAMIYSNAVLLKIGKNDSSITREHDLEVSFRCAFLRTGVFVTFGFLPIGSKTVIPSGSTPDGTVSGNFSFDIAMFQNDNYTKPFEEKDFPVQVELGQRLFFEVGLKTNDSHLTLFVDNCRATPTKNPYDPHRFTFIEDGCSRENSVRQVGTDGQRKKFSLEAFRFSSRTDLGEVYMHCELQVCHSTELHTRCAMGCLRQRREIRIRKDSADPVSAATVSVGPIVISREEEEEDEKGTTEVTVPVSSYSVRLMVLSIAAVLGLLIICGTLITVYYLKIRGRYHEAVVKTSDDSSTTDTVFDTRDEFMSSTA